MKASKYIILPLLLIGSTFSLLVGNPDSDKAKPTFIGRITNGFDRITNKIENSKLFNRISFETLDRACKAGLAILVGQTAYLAYLQYKIYNGRKALIKKFKKEAKQVVKDHREKMHQLEIGNYKTIIAKQQAQLEEAKRREQSRQYFERLTEQQSYRYQATQKITNFLNSVFGN